MKFAKPYIYFWVSSLIIFSLGLFTYSDENAIIDINVHDTYYIIHLFHLISLISFFYFLLGSFYWVSNKLKVPLVSHLTNIHLFTSIGGFFIYLASMLIFEDDSEIEPGIFNEYSILGWIILILICIIFISQILFLLNISIGLTKRLIKRNKTS